MKLKFVLGIGWFLFDKQKPCFANYSLPRPWLPWLLWYDSHIYTITLNISIIVKPWKYLGKNNKHSNCRTLKLWLNM